MRNFIDIVQQKPTALMEAVLLEYHNFGHSQMAPAFAALYEQEQQRQGQLAVTDKMLADILAKHNNDVAAAVSAIKQHGKSTGTTELRADPEARWVGSDQHKASVVKVRDAMEQWHKLATRKQPLVADAEQFLDAKTDEVSRKLDAAIEPNSKFAPYKTRLQRMLGQLKELSKAHPKKSALIVAAVGVISGLLTAGGPWVGGAITMILRMLMMIWQGETFGSALRKSLASGAVGVLAGFGIGAAMTSIDAWLNAAQAAAPEASAPAGDAQQAAQEPREPAAQSPSAPAADAANPVATTPYIDQLRQIVDPTGQGTGIPTMNQSRFGEAFRAAREAMGPGNVFVWNNNVYTTNTAQEGLLSGLSDAAKRFLRGAR